MNLFFMLQTKIKKSGFLVILISLFFYFAYYAINGDRGLLTYVYLKKEINLAKNVSKGYSQEKQKLEDKVKLLSSNSLDLDLLEERARIVLNLVKKDEFILLDTEE